jgi:hypothetical protein
MFFIEHNGRLRHFMVGAEDEETAKLAVQQLDPTVNFLNFVSKMRAEARLINMLGLTGGKVMEWLPGNPGEKLSVHPGSVDIGSDYDPLRKK